MLPVTRTALEALLRPHEMYTRLEVWRGGVKLLTGLPYLAGDVRATLQSRVTRTLDLTLDPSWFPESPTDLLSPFGSEIRAWRGVSVGGVTNHPGMVWPVFRGPIDEVVMDTAGSCSLKAVDRAGDVVGSELERPLSVSAGSRLHASVRSAISEALDDAEFDAFTLEDRELPSLAWATDRGKALDDMAGGAGGFWYAMADGTFTLRPVPWVYGSGVVDLTINSAAPLFRYAQIKYSRQGVVNTVVVNAERTDGSAPERYVARDTDPASPLRYGGPFGRRVMHASPNASFGAGAPQMVGDTLLQRSKAVAQSWSATIASFPPLELGDLIQFDVASHNGGRRRSKQVVSGFTMPLTASGDMSLELRSLMPKGEAVV